MRDYGVNNFFPAAYGSDAGTKMPRIAFVSILLCQEVHVIPPGLPFARLVDHLHWVGAALDGEHWEQAASATMMPVAGLLYSGSFYFFP